MEPIFLPASDGHDIPVYLQEPKGPALATLQIVHGTPDAADRYARAMQVFAAAGIRTAISDLRGHHRACTSPEDRLFFAEHNGWNNLVDDVHRIDGFLRADGCPHFLLGMGIGGMLVQTYLFKYGSDLRGAMLLNTWPRMNPVRLRALETIAENLAGRKGIRYRSPLLDRCVFGRFRRRFGKRGDYAYLTKDVDEAERFLRHPMTVGMATVQLYRDLFFGLQKVQSEANLAYVPDDVPLLFLCGGMDPEAGSIRQQEALVDFYAAAGKDARLIYWKQGRHDLLHDIEAPEVERTIIDWMLRQRGGAAPCGC